MSSIAKDGPAPGCLVLLLQLSASMSRDMPTHRGDCPKYQAVRFLADGIIEDQVTAMADGSLPITMHVCLAGYRGSDDDPTTLVSLLPDGITRPHFIKLADLATIDVAARRGNQPRKWCVNVEVKGDPDPVAALAEVHWLVQRWLAERPEAAAPVVVHCGDGTGWTGAYELVARSLAVLNAAGPPLLLCHCLFSESHSGRFLPNLYGGRLPEPFQRIWEASSPLPPPARPNCLDHAPRALTINEWPRRETQLFEFIDPAAVPPLDQPPPEARDAEAHSEPPALDPPVGEEAEPAEAATSEPSPPAEAAAPVGEALFSYRALWLQKRGNDAKEWEDSFDVDPLRGSVAVSDGAGEGIFCRQWSALLAESWARDRPDLDDVAAYSAWLNRCRATWMERINYPNTRPIQRMKINDVGAAATFLGFWVERLPLLPDQPAPYLWRAIAAGDSCVLWVRGSTLLATFPLTHGEQFRMPPLLVRTKRLPPPALARASGACQEGDLFLLATDAVSHRLLDENELGPVDWARYETIDPAAWEQEIHRLRDENLIVNDDCTLVVVRIASPSPPAAPPMPFADAQSPPAIPEPHPEIVGDP